MEESIARHRQHIVRLEQILRLLDNDAMAGGCSSGVGWWRSAACGRRPQPGIGSGMDGEGCSTQPSLGLAPSQAIRSAALRE